MRIDGSTNIWSWQIAIDYKLGTEQVRFLWNGVRNLKTMLKERTTRDRTELTTSRSIGNDAKAEKLVSAKRPSYRRQSDSDSMAEAKRMVPWEMRTCIGPAPFSLSERVASITVLPVSIMSSTNMAT